MFTKRILGEPCVTYVYFGKEKPTADTREKKIFFTKDDFHALNDCQLINMKRNNQFDGSFLNESMISMNMTKLKTNRSRISV